MPNKTISVPADVLSIIEGLDVPFSHWVTAKLREHASDKALPFAEQLERDAILAGSAEPPDRQAVGERMGRSATW